MKRAILVLIAVACILVARVAAHSASAKVTLQPECEVQPAKVVTVRDIARIEGPEELARKIGGVTVATGPAPGARRSIESKYVELRLRAANLAAEVSVAGPSEVSLIGRCARFSPDELAEEAKAFVLSRLPQGSRTCEVNVERAPREIVAPAGDTIEIRPRLLGATVRPGANTVALDAVIDGKTAATSSATVQVTAVAEALVTTTHIRQGEALTAANTAWEMRDITRLPDALLMPDDGRMLDWISRRTLGPGTVVSAASVVLPPTVRQGETVSLLVRSGNVTLRTSAEVRQDGRTGDMVRVRSAISNEDIRARVAEPGVVEISR